MAMQLVRNVFGNFFARTRSFSAAGLGAAAMARRGTAAVAPPSLGAPRQYSVGASSAALGEKILTAILENGDLCFAGSFAVTLNFLYLMDFDGHWEKKRAADKLEREYYAESIQDMKNESEELEARLERERAVQKI